MVAGSARWGWLPIAAWLVLGAGVPGAAADDCAALGGVISSGECQISTPQAVSGTFSLAETLHLLAGASLTVPAAGTLRIDVCATPPTGCAAPPEGTCDFVMDVGSQISGNVNAANGIGADVIITASRDLVLHGNGASGATITVNQQGGSCTGGGRAGSVKLTAGGIIVTEDGSVVSANGTPCPAGPICVAAGSVIELGGDILSESTLSGTGAVQRPGGGPITVIAGCDLTVDGTVSSKGQDPGADLVHLQGGCDVEINGLVQSTGRGHAVPNSPTNHCYYQIAGFPSPPQTPVNAADDPQMPRTDKEPDSTVCLEIWANKSLTINSIAPNAGEVNIDSAQAGGLARGWADLFANGDIFINNDAILPYSIHANEFVSNSEGSCVDVESVNGKVSTTGLAIQSNGAFGMASGGKGGDVTLEAGGLGSPAGDVDLDAASIEARGDNTGGAPAGGMISVRSFSGSVLGTAPGELDAFGGNPANGVVTLEACLLVSYTGVSTPPFIDPPGNPCGGTPTLPSYVTLPAVCPCDTTTTTSSSTSTSSSSSSSTSTSSTTSSSTSTSSTSSTSTSSTTSSTESTSTSSTSSTSTSSTTTTSSSTSTSSTSSTSTSSPTTTSSSTSTSSTSSTSTSSTTTTSSSTSTSSTSSASTSSTTTSSSPPTTVPLPPPVTHFQCYEIRPPQAFSLAGIALLDEFGAMSASLTKASAVCAPADKRGEDPAAVTAPGHLTAYQLKGPKFPRRSGQGFRDQFGALLLDLVKPARLLVPSGKSLDGDAPPPPAGLDHYTCYKAKRSGGSARFQKVLGVPIETQFESATIDIVKPLRLCVPTDKNGEGVTQPDVYLLCYRVRSSGTFPPLSVSVDNQFGPQTFLISQRREFCVPAERSGPYGSPSRAFLAAPEGLLD